MVRNIYIDTSVFGGVFDEEFSDATVPFFEHIITKGIRIITSDILELEIYRAPNYVIEFYESINPQIISKVALTEEVRSLAHKYINENVVGMTSLADCQHIALSTIYQVGVLASWNFKHIVNLEKIRGYNSINLREGYGILEIRTPIEIFTYEND